MAFDITPYVDKTPAEVRALCRDGVIDFPTAGMCRGYAQANLVILRIPEAGLQGLPVPWLRTGKPCNPASGIRSRFRRICKKESISLSDS